MVGRVRVAAVVLGVVLLAASAACGDDDGVQTSTQPGPTSSSTATVPDGGSGLKPGKKPPTDTTT